MTESQLEKWSALDISCWYSLWQQRDGKCPNCGSVFSDMHPAQNIYPHWTGACKSFKASAVDGVQDAGSGRS